MSTEFAHPRLSGRRCAENALALQERADEAERRAREAVELIRIRAALSRLTTGYAIFPCKQAI